MIGDPIVGSITTLSDSWTSTGITTTAHSTLPGSGFHYHYHGCGCGTTYISWPAPTPHQHDYQQANGEYEHLLYCRTCGETKRLNKAKAKAAGL